MYPMLPRQTEKEMVMSHMNLQYLQTQFYPS